MPIPEIEKALFKYRKDEEIINSKIRKRNEQGIAIDNNMILQHKLSSKSLGQAKDRNKMILKDLEIAKGNLRSKAIYSPSEMQWKTIQEKYKNEPSLIVTKWRCHLPVTV